MSNRYVVIMAGGKGERFWPQSRIKRPKHLLPIVGDKPMLTQTVDRLDGLVPIENILIITNIEQREAVLDVCPNLLPENAKVIAVLENTCNQTYTYRIEGEKVREKRGGKRPCNWFPRFL